MAASPQWRCDPTGPRIVVLALSIPARCGAGRVPDAMAARHLRRFSARLRPQQDLTRLVAAPGAPSPFGRRVDAVKPVHEGKLAPFVRSLDNLDWDSSTIGLTLRCRLSTSYALVKQHFCPKERLSC